MKLEQAARHLVALWVAERPLVHRHLHDAISEVEAALAAPVGEGQPNAGDQMTERTVLDFETVAIGTRQAIAFGMGSVTDLGIAAVFCAMRSHMQAAQRIKHAAAHESAEAAGEQSAAPTPTLLWVMCRHNRWQDQCMACEREANAAKASGQCAPAAGPSSDDGSLSRARDACRASNPYFASALNAVREPQAEPVAWLDFASGAPARFETNDRHPIFTEAATRPFDELRIALYAAQERPPAERAQVPREPTECRCMKGWCAEKAHGCPPPGRYCRKDFAGATP